MNKFFNAVKSELSAVMSGNKFTKNYEVESRPYMTAGLHDLWSVYRAEKRGQADRKASVFMIEKKNWDKSKSQ